MWSKHTRMNHELAEQAPCSFKIIRQNCPGRQNQKTNNRRIFKIRYLNFSRSELNPPSNIRIRRWRFEPHRLPIRRLQILEMFTSFGIIKYNSIFELGNRVPNPQMTDV